jgi:hypothetical protein
MKKYRLKKDLPFAKAGDMVEMWSNGTIAFIGEPNLPRFNKKDVKMFPLWFEEVEEPERYFSINIFKATVEEVKNIHYSEWAIENMKSIGILFETQEEAEEYLAYLKAKAIIKQDTKGFKPNWNDTKQIKYSCFYDEDRFTGHGCVKPAIEETSTKMGALIYFKSEDDIKESLKKHPEEWRKYLFYEQ